MAKVSKLPKGVSSRFAPKTADEAEAVFFARLRKSASDLNWTLSAATGKPIDRSGDPCPWYTYPMLHFIETRDVSKLAVFEYGSGNSTLWWARHAHSVTSVEHSKGWFDRMRPELPANVAYVHRELVYGGDYGREVLNHATDFDVVVIDGRDRVNCARACVGKLGDHAAIIWDNSSRVQYAEGYALLEDAGYRRLDFRGFGPVNARPWTTSIFYKPGNCLAI